MRLIDADVLRDEYQAILDRGDMFCEYDIIGMLDNAPTVNVMALCPVDFPTIDDPYPCCSYKRPRGEWIDIDSLVNKARCSNCKNIMITEPYGKTNFCPNCGADMRKEANNEVN